MHPAPHNFSVLKQPHLSLLAMQARPAGQFPDPSGQQLFPAGMQPSPQGVSLVVQPHLDAAVQGRVEGQ